MISPKIGVMITGLEKKYRASESKKMEKKRNPTKEGCFLSQLMRK
jgi:hypothetical protein